MQMNLEMRILGDLKLTLYSLTHHHSPVIIKLKGTRSAHLNFCVTLSVLEAL